MSEKFQLHTVQNLIGYTFKSPSLLATAFTHTSAAKKDEESNEGLSFLGKAVCELLIHDYLYSNFMKLEAVDFSVLDAELKVDPLLNKITEKNRLADYVMLSPSAEALRSSHVVEKELFFAVTGAIYKDGGMPSVRAFVLPKLRAVISDDDPVLMREAKKDIMRKAGTDRDIFSDHSDSKEKRSATSALKTLFGSRKNKNAETENSQEPNRQIGANVTPRKKAAQEQRTANNVPPSGTRRSEERFSDNSVKKPPSPTQKAEPSDGNYKSALQEYVQKNIRSATVMLEYKDSKTANEYETEIHLFGKKIARASGASKKEASQNAAQKAYAAITAENGDAAAWFNRLKANPDAVLMSAESVAETDYVSELNRTYQKKLRRSDAEIKYEIISAPGKKTLSYSVTIGKEKLGIGEGKTAREAKQNAAKSALMKLGKL